MTAAVGRWLVALAMTGVAAGSIAGEPGRPLFASPEALSVTIEAPWTEVVRKTRGRVEPPARHAAVVRYVDASGAERRIEASVETRGLTRLRTCRFPPLRLRFTKTAVKGTLFEGQRSLKMVTHCMSGQQFEQYYVQELLAYRILNLVTDRSFRARPLSVTYVDTRNGKTDGPRFAFVIESLGEVGERTGSRRSPRAQFTPGAFDPLALGRVTLFQYLIGNTDWEVQSGPRADACCHNARVLEPRSGGLLFAVPYDFDSAGLVDASYAAPHETLPIRDVKQRLFRGFCAHNAELDTARQEFLERREAILGLVRDDPRLTPQRRSATTRYLEAFYAILATDARYERDIKGRCRR